MVFYLGQILFRGLIEGTDEWAYGDVLHDFDGVPRAITDYCGSNPVVPESVGQYIGLQDMGGKKAFAGDISMDMSMDGTGRLWVVFDCAGGFGTCTLAEWMKKDRTAVFLYEGLSDPQNASWFHQNHEIVGTVHDRDLREFIGCDRSAEDYDRVCEILCKRINDMPLLDAIIQACEAMNKNGANDVAFPAVKRDR